MKFEELIEKIKNKEMFSFSRFGDGEMNAVFGKEGMNCDSHRYFPDMGLRFKSNVK